MSCRLVPAGEAGDVKALVWRQPGDAGGAAAQPSRPGVSGGLRGAGQEQQLEALLRDAFERGRREGEAAANDRLGPALDSLQGVIRDLAGVRKRFRAEAEEDTVKLAIAIARRVLHRELATDPEAILGLVIAAFQRLNSRETFRLRVSPGAAAALEQNRARLDVPQGLELCADATLASGSAIFETSRGDLDISVDTQLAEIQRGFADLIRRSSR